MANGRQLKNIGNAITRLLMDHFGQNLVVTSHHVADMSAMMWLSFSIYGRLEEKRVNRFQRNLDCKMSLNL